MVSYRILVLFLVAAIVISAPLAAQPVPSTTSVTFQYSAGGANNNSQGINFTGGTISSARVSQNVDQNGNQVNAGAFPNSAAGVFSFNVSGNSIAVGLDNGTLATLAQRGQNTYNGIMLVSYPGGTDGITINLTLNIGSNGQITVNPTSITLAATPGATASTTFTISTSSVNQVSFVMSSNQQWLTLAQTGGTNGVIGGSAGSATVTVTANSAASGIIAGANSATITITSSIGSPTVPVTFNVGTSNTLTLSSTSLQFSYAINTQTYVPANSQNVTVSGAGTGTSLSAIASSQSNWLLVNNAISTTGIIGQTFTITVNPLALGNPPPSNTYSGTVVFTTTSGASLSATLNVSLTISGSGSGVNTPLTFNVTTSGSGAPAPQPISISGTGTLFVSPSTNNGGAWLTANPLSTSVAGSTQISVSVNPSPNGVPLPAGTYSGQLQIFLNGVLLQTTSVTMNIGGSTTGGQFVAPTSLTFNVPPGGSQTQYFIIAGTGANYQASAFGNGISVSPLGGQTPAVVSVSVNANSAGVTAGLNSGYVNISSGATGIPPVNVSLNVLNGSVISGNPAAYAIQFTPGQSTLLPNLTVSSTSDANNQNLAFTVQVPNFISINPVSGTTPTTFALAINPNVLQSGFNTGNIVIQAPNAANTALNIPVTVLAPGTTPGLALSPSSLSLSAASGSGVVSQTVSVSGLTGTSYSISASSTLPNGTAANWLSVSPASGTSPSSFTVNANPSTLNAGTTYNGTVTVTASNGTSVVLNVSFTVGTPTTVMPNLILTSSNVSFNYQLGNPAPAAQTVQVNTNGNSVSFSISTSAPWILVTPSANTTPANLSITIDPSKVNAGTNSGFITVTAPGATGSPQQIQVTANVTNVPMLTVSTGTVGISYTTGGTAPGSQTAQVGSTTGDPLAFTLSITPAPWLTVTPTSGTTPATLTFTVDPTKVSVGTSLATVSINAAGSSQTITVTLTVSAPLPTITSVVNAASQQPGPISAGEVILISGNAMGPDTPVMLNVTNGVLDNNLSSTRVRVGGFLCPMVLASSTQVAAIVPFEIDGKSSTFVEVEYLGQRSNDLTMPVASSAPGVFPAGISGLPGGVLNGDGSPNSGGNPEPQNGRIIVTVTGVGQTNPPGVDGQLAADTSTTPVQTVTATINGEPAQVVGATSVPGLVAGVMQVTIQVPADGSSGDVIVTVGNNSSQPGVSVSVH